MTKPEIIGLICILLQLFTYWLLSNQVDSIPKRIVIEFDEYVVPEKWPRNLPIPSIGEVVNIGNKVGTVYAVLHYVGTGKFEYSCTIRVKSIKSK